MQSEVCKILQSIEDELDCQVLYCCESGSRAWGFASPDSDFDIRFIYVHKRDWYLELQEKPDMIDRMLPEDLDITGWDLMKSLRLFRTCNLGLNEWFDSPEVYSDPHGFRNRISELIPAYFNPKKAMHHYLSLARSTGEKNFNHRSIKIKKLFYVIRPLLAALWIDQYERMPPTCFYDLLRGLELPETQIRLIDQMLEFKKDAVEGEIIETPEDLFLWTKELLDELSEKAPSASTGQKPEWGPLNRFWFEYLEPQR